MQLIIRKNIYKILMLLLSIFLQNGCKHTLVDNKNVNDHKMYVYVNYGNTFYQVDYQTYEVVKEIKLPLPDSLECHGMILSTNRNYLFFRTTTLSSETQVGFVAYDIAQEKIHNIYFTDLKTTEPASFISAEDPSVPGLVLVHYRDLGTFSIDVLNQSVQKMIAPEHSFNLNKRLLRLSEDNWDIAIREWYGKNSYTDVEFYLKGTKLGELQFTLNKLNSDSIFIYDIIKSKNNRLYVSYLASGGSTRGIESYLGYYDLQTKTMFRSLLTVPWSLNPYYLGYNSSRNEIYMIGASDQFYIIDAQSCGIKKVITLAGKIAGASQILIHPNADIVFLSCSDSNKIFVIDLNEFSITRVIEINHPYTMIIP